MDLATNYLGIELEHPVVASSSPQSKDLDGVKRLADAGAAAITLFSLFEEQIRQERDALEFLVGRTSYVSSESLGYFPEPSDYHAGPAAYLELVYRASQAVDVPIIASLNGVTASGWTDYAKEMVQAGARALELNLYFLPLDMDLTGEQVERQYVEVLAAVREAVSAPIAVKLSPYFSATANMAQKLVEAGADGLVLFNRFYQPDFDIERRSVESRLDLSQPTEIRLPLLWIAFLYGRLQCSLAATTGVESHVEALKYVMAGADAVMATSALLRHGEKHLGSIVSGMRDWMVEHEFESVRQMRGSMSHQNCAEPEAFARANYLKLLQGFASVGR